MNKSNYLLEIEKCAVDESKISQIEKQYNYKAEGLVAKVISYTDSSIFVDDEKRVMAFSEIVQKDNEYDNIFTKEKIIPVIDCFDGEFIVFVIKDNQWAKYSTSDNVVYKKRLSLAELI